MVSGIAPSSPLVNSATRAAQLTDAYEFLGSLNDDRRPAPLLDPFAIAIPSLLHFSAAVGGCVPCAISASRTNIS
jgi:hypothetical protein